MHVVARVVLLVVLAFVMVIVLIIFIVTLALPYFSTISISIPSLTSSLSFHYQYQLIFLTVF